MTLFHKQWTFEQKFFFLFYENITVSGAILKFTFNIQFFFHLQLELGIRHICVSVCVIARIAVYCADYGGQISKDSNLLGYYQAVPYHHLPLS